VPHLPGRIARKTVDCTLGRVFLKNSGNSVFAARRRQRPQGVIDFINKRGFLGDSVSVQHGVSQEEREKRRQKRTRRGLAPRGAADDRIIRQSRRKVTHPRTARDPTRRASPARPPEACRCRCCTRPSLGHPRCAVIANPPAVHTTTRHHCSAILPATEYSIASPDGATGRAPA